jgi:uncharacterized phage protein gp47/JayE
MPALLVVRAILGRALSFLGKLNLWQLGCIALALFAGVQTLRLAAETRHSHKVEAQLAKSGAARHADRLAYAKAQEAAQAKNKAQVAQIEQHYQRNSDNEREAYLSDLAKLRASRVRPKAAPSSPGAADTPADDIGTPRINADGLCVPETSDVCEAGAEIELRLMHLQNLFERQSQVNPNK